VTHIEIRQATAEDLDAAVELQDEAIRWLGSKGLEQWQPSARGSRHTPDLLRRNIGKSIERGECYMVFDGNEPVGTITIDTFADPEFWTTDDKPEDALYVHRMVVRRTHAGTGIGEQMLEFALALAFERGKHWLRLDAWRTNEALHAYYRKAGFQHVRTVEYPHRGSGALFQRATSQDCR
jgi:ribosomal protein S18 acetylase RimI-like enzyme